MIRHVKVSMKIHCLTSCFNQSLTLTLGTIKLKVNFLWPFFKLWIQSQFIQISNQYDLFNNVGVFKVDFFYCHSYIYFISLRIKIIATFFESNKKF